MIQKSFQKHKTLSKTAKKLCTTIWKTMHNAIPKQQQVHRTKRIRFWTTKAALNPISCFVSQSALIESVRFVRQNMYVCFEAVYRARKYREVQMITGINKSNSKVGQFRTQLFIMFTYYGVYKMYCVGEKSFHSRIINLYEISLTSVSTKINKQIDCKTQITMKSLTK